MLDFSHPELNRVIGPGSRNTHCMMHKPQFGISAGAVVRRGKHSYHALCFTMDRVQHDEPYRPKCYKNTSCSECENPSLRVEQTEF